MRLYSLFDRCHGQHGAPYQAPNDALAVRLFEEAAMDSASLFSKFPDDFTIFYVGDFDENTAQFQPANPPVYVQRGVPKDLV